MNTSIQWSDLVTLITVAALVGGGIWKAASLVSGIRQELTSYKVEVAKEYVSLSSMRALENRLADAIERLGDRLDRVFEREK